MLVASILLGFISSLLYFSWWFREDRIFNPWLALCFAGALFYFATQVFCAWYIYLRMKVPCFGQLPAPRVDVFVPVYDEPYDLVERSLTAVVAIRHAHRTYLLDDSGNPRFAALAARLGVEYLARPGDSEAKAGNVNAALAASNAEIVTVFDVDHIPEPDFFDFMLCHFQDPRVGFVQGAVGFRNTRESWIARAAAEQASDAYGPASMGMYGSGAGPLWGSHCTFRRTALESIGGHQSGLAEDLHTSLRLHAAGWHSVFVPAIKAAGLVPNDVVSATKQQFKWARGVFEIFLGVYPRVWRPLALSQNLAYLVRFTYYLVGPVILTHALLAASVLLFGQPLARAGFAEYLLYAMPLATAILLVRRVALSTWQRGFVSWEASWRGYVYAFLLWPAHTLALISSLLRVRVPHIATPKERSKQSHPWLVLPQILLVVLLLLAVAWRIAQGSTIFDALPIVFALFVAGLQSFAIVRSYVSSPAPKGHATHDKQERCHVECPSVCRE